ncbi:response regulator transcription factor [Mycolicibacterium vaccae]|uniref:response regulator transcription factor n=1 Tax=Mycolicibacterium vaccae TaxID=1810 RepID=UPI0016410DB9|nr:helix-turn-helix transcriptional regulator [Mycolicibacterium vaccae]
MNAPSMTDQLNEMATGLMSPVPEHRGSALLELLHAAGVAVAGMLTALDSNRRIVVVARSGHHGGLRDQVTISLLTPRGRYVGVLHLTFVSTPLPLPAVAVLDMLIPHAAGVAASVGRRSQLGLTPREDDILCAIAAGYTNAEISERDSVSVRTVTTQVESIFRKLGVRNRVQAARVALDCCLQDRRSSAPHYSAGLTSDQGREAS